VKYATAAAFRTALETRLLSRSKSSGTSLVRLRKTVVFDRLLARLQSVAPGRWVLKGALAHDYRLGDQARTTKDIDLARQDDEKAATADFLAAQAAELEDYFVFAIERTAALDELRDGSAVRYHAACQLAGRAFDDITVDVGFSDRLIGEPEFVRGPDVLAFADIEPVFVPALPLAQHVAEKVHAYTREYGTRGVASTRVKDLVDLALIAGRSVIQSEELRRALVQTFQHRRLQSLPGELPRPPREWTTPYRRMASEVGISGELAVGHHLAAELIDPVLADSVADATWNPTAVQWRPTPEEGK
jgi:hypothetical protein